jgi:hypothetical protein
MARYVSEIEGHRIEVDVSAWSGMEVVSYDGREVSRRRNLTTFFGVHDFEVTEGGESVVYEVNVMTGFGTGFIVRRNGIVRAHRP